MPCTVPHTVVYNAVEAESRTIMQDSKGFSIEHSSVVSQLPCALATGPITQKSSLSALADSQSTSEIPHLPEARRKCFHKDLGHFSIHEDGFSCFGE